MNPQLWWYVARAGGMLAWLMIALSILWGLTLSTRVAAKAATPAWLLDLHRYFGALAVAFTAVHLVGLWADSYVEFGLADLLLPMASEWKTGPVAWGVIGFYLLIAVQVTSLLQKRMSRKWWRRTHMLSFPLFVVGTVHTLWSGTDVQNPLYRWGSLVVVWAITFLTIARVLIDRRAKAAARRSRIPAAARAKAAASKDAVEEVSSTEGAEKEQPGGAEVLVATSGRGG